MSGGIDSITSLLEKAQRLNTELGDGSMIRAALVLHERDVLDINRETLYSGRDSNNQEVEPPYRPSTVRMKKSKGQPYDRVTLKDSGTFYSRFVMLYGEDAFEITSEDWKVDDLIAKYGRNIFGLTDEAQGDLSHMLRDTLLNDINILFSE